MGRRRRRRRLMAVAIIIADDDRCGSEIAKRASFSNCQWQESECPRHTLFVCLFVCFFLPTNHLDSNPSSFIVYLENKTNKQTNKQTRFLWVVQWQSNLNLALGFFCIFLKMRLNNADTFFFTLWHESCRFFVRRIIHSVCLAICLLHDNCRRPLRFGHRISLSWDAKKNSLCKLANGKKAIDFARKNNLIGSNRIESNCYESERIVKEFPIA